MQAQTKKNVKNFIATGYIVLAILIGVKGNLDVLSGKPILNVIPSMFFQGIELIVKANRSRKSLEKIDRPSQPRITPNSD